MVAIVGIRFKRVGRIYFFDPHGYDDLQIGEWVIVETAKGTEAGRVVITPRQVQESQVTIPSSRWCGARTRADVLAKQYYRAQEPAVLATCQERVVAHHLPMKLIEADYSYDGSRLTVAFTAEGRVDFRELVKDLAGVFKTRIELRQIGDRDEAKVYERVRPVRASLLLLGLAPGFPAGVHQDGQGAGAAAQPEQDHRRLRALALLPVVRKRFSTPRPSGTCPGSARM